MRNSRWRWLGIAMPVAMTASVMGTANHYVVDWVIGCAIAAACFAAAWWWQRRTARPPATRQPSSSV
jgi:hypothetical protein